MVGLPVLNPRLTVAATAFLPWDGHRVGVLVTPWSINLAAVSDDPEQLRLPVDVRRLWRFPSGDYEFMGGEEPECGCFQFCSLFSPVLEFADQSAAMATAEAACRGLFLAGMVALADAGESTLAAACRPDAHGDDPASAAHAGSHGSRRGFLRGLLGAQKA